jgi:hypothetical protein
MRLISDGFLGFIDAIRKINERYRHPRIKMTRMVSFWLLMLRIYLLAMLLLLLFKFVTLVAQ